MEKAVRIHSQQDICSHPASPSGSQTSTTNLSGSHCFGSQLAAQNKRKEKARIAARARRSQEANIIMEMANELHITQEKIRRIDKATIVKLAIDYIKAFEILCRLRGSSLSGNVANISTSSSSNLPVNSINTNSNSSNSSISSSSGYEDSQNTSSFTINNQHSNSNNTSSSSSISSSSIISDSSSSSSSNSNIISNKATKQNGLSNNSESGNTCCCTCCCNQTTKTNHINSSNNNDSINARESDNCDTFDNRAPDCITSKAYRQKPIIINTTTSTNTTNTRNDDKTTLNQFKFPPVAAYSAPKLNTGLIFAPKTEDMDSHFLIINEERNGRGTALILKPDTEILDEDDLTHLAPQAGDVSISLDAEPLDGIELDTSLFSSCSPPTKKPAPLFVESCYIGTIGTVD